MCGTLHITNGDSAGDILAKSGIVGEVLVWRDILYDGPRDSGWPDDDVLNARARFLAGSTGGGPSREHVLGTLKRQYGKLAMAADMTGLCSGSTLACLISQCLFNILTCLRHLNIRNADLICADAFPGIVPFDGLGQLRPSQMASLHDKRRPVTDDQFLSPKSPTRLLPFKIQSFLPNCHATLTLPCRGFPPPLHAGFRNGRTR